MSLSNRLFSEAFRDIQRAVSALEHPVLNTVAPLIGNRTGNSLLHYYPAADLVETPKGYELHADLPGFDKNNIKIELPDDRTLILSGSMDEQHESCSDDNLKKETTDRSKTVADDTKEYGSEKNQVATKSQNTQVGQYKPHYWVNERVSGAFSRSFRYPSPVNTQDITASFKDGILKVVLPKSAEDQSKKINID